MVYALTFRGQKLILQKKVDQGGPWPRWIHGSSTACHALLILTKTVQKSSGA